MGDEKKNARGQCNGANSREPALYERKDDGGDWFWKTHLFPIRLP
jgi:hypothetical protein